MFTDLLHLGVGGEGGVCVGGGRSVGGRWGREVGGGRSGEGVGREVGEGEAFNPFLNFSHL